MGSRLFNEVREKRGLAYTIGTGLQGLDRAGYFFIFGSTTPGNLREVLNVCRGELEDVAANGPTPGEVDTARCQVERNYLLALESNGFLAARNAEREFYGEPRLNTTQVITALRRVTPRDIQRAATTLYTDKAPVLSLVGPLKHVSKLDSIINFSSNKIGIDIVRRGTPQITARR